MSGRASTHETVEHVAAHIFVRKIILDLIIGGAVIVVVPHHINCGRWNWSKVYNNPFLHLLLMEQVFLLIIWINYLKVDCLLILLLRLLQKMFHMVRNT
nr:hypothetical protein BAR15_120020 [Bartonella sp. AR 15-3]